MTRRALRCVTFGLFPFVTVVRLGNATIKSPRTAARFGLTLVLLFTAGITTPVAVTPLIVNTTSDHDDGNCQQQPNGDCTLREAMREANIPGPDTITFSIPTTDLGFNGEWWTIRLATNLPTLVDSGTTINGLSQGTLGTLQSDLLTPPGVIDDPNNPFCERLSFIQPTIAVDAQNNSEPFSISGTASDITLIGMAVYDAGPGLFGGDGHAVIGLSGNGTNREVRSMFIGVLPTGADPDDPDDDPTTLPPFDILDSVPGDRNKEFGVRQQGDVGELEIYESLVGYNGKGGIDGGASQTVLTVESNEAFENGWASNAHDGIDINGINGVCRCNVSRDNTNLPKVPNGGAGNGLEIGSKTPGAQDLNVVEYNSFYRNISAGISSRSGPVANFIRKNVVFENQVGISVNKEATVARRQWLTQNSTYMNMGLGIDLQHASIAAPWTGFAIVPEGTLLGPDGVTPNDPCDVDEGSNDLQNFPELTEASSFPTITEIRGTLNSTPTTTFRIEFFATPIDALFGVGDREGKDFIGAIFVTTDVHCNAMFAANFPVGVSDENVITATATKFTDINTPWSTSEYSGPIHVAEFVSEGKVTGGGWFYQPVGAHPAPGTDQPRGNFGFNAQANGAPKGHTNFVYHAEGMKLHFGSTMYEVVLIQRNPDGTGKARWRGEGRLNNKPNHCFRANVEDNNEPGTADRWRIKIWAKTGADCTDESNVKYDNDPSEIGTIINGGNIQIHPPN